MRFLFAVLLTLFVNTTKASRVNSAPFNTGNLQVKWEVIQNNYQNKPQSLNVITLINKDKEAFPANGWKIYFNSSLNYLPSSPTGNVRVDHITGDLFSFTPSAAFTELKPGQFVKIEFIATDNVVNFTDAPEGLYLVWDARPEKGYPLDPINILPFQPDLKGMVTPEITFKQNAAIADIPENRLPRIFPSPMSYTETQGFFQLNSGVKLANDDRFDTEKKLLSGQLGKLLEKSGSSDNSIRLLYKEGMNPEGYDLQVNHKLISITASTSTGIFYGIQSLLSLLPPVAWAKPQSDIKIPCLMVQDAPRFGYRSFLLDVARNFQTKKQVERLLDLLALYKINTFHFHLTDDEGWRLEIPSLPELTQVGSQRGHTLDSKQFLHPSHGSGPDTGKLAGSGFYSKADYIEILKYATERHITVITEIETPGHARAAIKSMNARYAKFMAQGKKMEAGQYLLNDLNDKSEYMSRPLWNDDVMDVSLPSTLNFIEAVIDDIIEMYKEAGAPLNAIHFGGDEVAAHVWEKSPAYFALKKDHPEIQDTDDLWYYFYGRINTMLKAKGLSLIGWEEMALRKTQLDGKPIYIPNPGLLPEHLQIEVWNNSIGDGNEDLAYRLANYGYKVVLSCASNFYFDLANDKSFDEPGIYWGGFPGMDKAFSFIPFDYFKNTKTDKNGLPIDRNLFIGKQRLTDFGKSNIAGIQCAIWGEAIKTPERQEYMLLPRLLAFAERAWSPDPIWATTNDTLQSRQLYAQAWSTFLNVLGKRELPRLDYLNGGYGYRIPRPGVMEQDGKLLTNEQFPGMVIRYTTNGKDPDINSPVYRDAITTPKSTIKFRAFNSTGRSSNTSTLVKQ